jgi:hypothetical protein
MTSLPQVQALPGEAEHDEPSRGVSDMPVQTQLKPVIELSAEDMVIGPPPQLPLFEGLEDESLICPGCGDEVTIGVSALTVQALFKPPGRLLFHCSCDAYGEVSRPGSPSKH